MQDTNKDWVDDRVCAQDYYALLREFGQVQQRVSKLLAEKMALIADLQEELARLQAQPKVMQQAVVARPFYAESTANASWYLAAV